MPAALACQGRSFMSEQPALISVSPQSLAVPSSCQAREQSTGLPVFRERPAPQPQPDIDQLRDIEMDVRIELGKAKMRLGDVMKLGDGAVVELDRLAGDPVDVLVNDRLVARGEVVVVNDRFAVRLTEVLSVEKGEEP